MIRVVLADDHHMVRQGLRLLLDSENDLAVVGEEADGLGVVELVDRVRPDVLIVDLMMPGLGGLEVTRQVTHRIPTTRVLVLSMHQDEAYVLEALRNGASGYVLKSAGSPELLEAVREVSDGRRYLSAPLSERAIEAYVQKAHAVSFDLYETLTRREREVLHLAAEGHSNPAIGERLSISPRTAETHRANLMRKLDLRGQADLIRYAIRRGIVADG